MHTTDTFAAIYDAHYQKIYNFLYYKVIDRDTAEDLASQTFLKALERFTQFNPEKGTITQWLYRIAHNTVIDHYRTKRPVSPLEHHTDLTTDDNIPHVTDQKMRLEKVQKYLDQLTPEQRTIVIMRVWDDLPYKDIATITGKSEPNCKMIFARAVKTIQKTCITVTLSILLLFHL